MAMAQSLLDPPQALGLDQFRRALRFHGFAIQLGPFGMMFVDLRLGVRVVDGPVRRRAADGRIFVDRLATLDRLLAWRRESIAAQRRARPILAILGAAVARGLAIRP